MALAGAAVSAMPADSYIVIVVGFEMPIG